MNIVQNVPIQKVMQEIGLTYDWSPCHPEDREKAKIFKRISAKAAESEEFAEAFAETVQEAFSRIPDIIDVKWLVLDSVYPDDGCGSPYRKVRELLEDNGVIEGGKQESV